MMLERETSARIKTAANWEFAGNPYFRQLTPPIRIPSLIWKLPLELIVLHA
jgi:hypothetical protein